MSLKPFPLLTLDFSTFDLRLALASRTSIMLDSNPPEGEGQEQKKGARRESEPADDWSNPPLTDRCRREIATDQHWHDEGKNVMEPTR